MNIAIAPMKDILLVHAWIDDAATSALTVPATGAVVVLNAQGIAILRNQGRHYVVSRLNEHLSLHDMEPPQTWRLVEAMPALSVDLILNSPRTKLPTVLAEQRVKETFSIDLSVPLDLHYFSGHFPTAPVLPGVVQVAWALELAAPYLRTPKHCHSMEALKFQRFLRPGDRVTLDLRAHPDGGKLYFTYRQGEQHCSSGRLLWKVST